MRRSKLWVLLGIGIGIGVLVVPMLLARDVVTYYGCLECEYDTNVPSFPDDHCVQVGHDEYGAGIECREVDYGLGHLCVTGGGPCFNVNAPGGGPGGGGGGGGGGGCAIAPGEACPAACWSCTIQYF